MDSIEEELDFEPECEEYTNNLLYGDIGEEPEKETTDENNGLKDNKNNDKSNQIVDERGFKVSDEQTIKEFNDKNVEINDEIIGDKRDKKLTKKNKSIERKNDVLSDLSLNVSIDSKRKKKKSSKSKDSDKKTIKSCSKDTKCLSDPPKEHNSVKTKNNCEMSSKSVISRAKPSKLSKPTLLEKSKKFSVEPQIIDSEVVTISENLSQNSDKYDTEEVCDPCIVIIDKYSDQWISKATKGEVRFEEIESEDSGVEQPNHFIQSSQEINCSDDGSEEHFKDIQTNDSEKTQNDLKTQNKFLSEKIKTVLNDLQLSGSSSEEAKEAKEAKRISRRVIAASDSDLSDCEPIKTKSGTKTENKKQKLRLDFSDNRKKNLSPMKKGVDSQTFLKKQFESDSKSGKRVKESKNQNSNRKKRKSSKKLTKISVTLPQSDIQSTYSCEQLSKEKFEQIINTAPISTTLLNEYKCDKCQTVCEDEMDLVLHSTEHITDKSPIELIACQMCSHLFFNMDSYKIHINDMHPTEESPLILNRILYTCEHCKQFTSHSLQEFQIHLNTHNTLITQSDTNPEIGGLCDFGQEGAQDSIQFPDNNNQKDLLSTVMDLTFKGDEDIESKFLIGLTNEEEEDPLFF